MNDEFPASQTLTSADSVWEAAPQCAFYVRTQVTDDPPTYRYDMVNVRGDKWGDSGRLVTPHPPMVGDQIWLNDSNNTLTGQYKVIERDWAHAAYGSGNWPLGSPHPKVGPSLHIIVVPGEGLFRDEAPVPDEEQR